FFSSFFFSSLGGSSFFSSSFFSSLFDFSLGGSSFFSGGGVSIFSSGLGVALEGMTSLEGPGPGDAPWGFAVAGENIDLVAALSAATAFADGWTFS
ncbi:hypothetical protein PENTCL1PPCAC_23275, partial [Pristionchus entomophagus]